MSSVEENKELVRRLIYEDINRGDREVASQIIAADFIDHTNPPGLQHGLEGHNMVVSIFHAAFSNFGFEIEEMIAEGDKVAIRVTMRGTHTGDLFGIPPTGKSVEVSGTHFLRCANGRVAEHWGTNDDMGLMQQLGVVPAPAEQVPA
jgi:steroid delta-isomerase-like uncharacterized protein